MNPKITIATTAITYPNQLSRQAMASASARPSSFTPRLAAAATLAAPVRLDTQTKASRNSRQVSRLGRCEGERLANAHPIQLVLLLKSRLGDYAVSW
jgi:hypothetical protein